MKTNDLHEQEEKIVEARIVSINELKKADEYQHWLEELMFMISHTMRQPVAHILGLSSLFNGDVKSPSQLNKIIRFMKQSAESLDKRTKELSVFINKRITDLEYKTAKD